MPPGRRKSTHPSNASSTTQRTLAFGPHPNKITKPNQAPLPSTLKNKNNNGNANQKPSSSSVSLEPSPKVSLTPSPPPAAAATAKVEERKEGLGAEGEGDDGGEGETHAQANLAIREQRPEPKAEVVEVAIPKKCEAEERAARVSEGDVRKYWRKQEAERKAPRVHQKDISMHEKILRHFDLSSQYGPCIGTTRLARWNRASKLGLNPPIEVLAVLTREDVVENRKLERAYLDELLEGKIGGE